MSITVTPQSTITLCKTMLENDYKNTINFNTLEAQTTYFNSLTNVVDVGNDDYTYVRKDNVINVSLPYDQIVNYNYLYYTNTGFTTKRYYCFITGMRYVNENLTEISIETDVIQTWMFDIEYKKCYVEREHVANDTIGVHTIPEGLETGEYIINGTDYMMYDTNTYVVISTSSVYNTPFSTPSSTTYNNVFSGDYKYTFSTKSEARNFLKIYDKCGQNAAINSVFMIPGTLYNKLQTTDDSVTYDGVTCNYKLISGTSATMIEQQKTIAINTTINGYSPHNNKLFVFPYNYLELDNNNGGSAVYYYEQFVNHSPSFQTAGALTPGCSIMCYPLNYNLINDDHISTPGMLYSYSNGLPAGKYPIGSWNTDVYTNWLTQTAVNRNVGLIGNTIKSIGSAFTGNVLGAAEGVGGIFQTAAEVYQHTLIPDETRGNINSGDVTFAMLQTMFAFKKKSIKQEYAKVIDGYFDMYGYKVNSLKTPQFTSRRYWNYIKTIDSNMEGDIPQQDLNKIRSIFDTGITFWHDTTHLMDYSQSNTIVS